jgi:hypothetical protein
VTRDDLAFLVTVGFLAVVLVLAFGMLAKAVFT